MKYNEFEQRIEEMGYRTVEQQNQIDVKEKRSGMLIACVDKHSLLTFSTDTMGFRKLTKDEKEKLSYLLYQLASTPLDEREKEKLYRLRLENTSVDSRKAYLNKSRSDGFYFLDSKEERLSTNSIFTESQLEYIDETGFVREEVERCSLN